MIIGSKRTDELSDKEAYPPWSSNTENLYEKLQQKNIVIATGKKGWNVDICASEIRMKSGFSDHKIVMVVLWVGFLRFWEKMSTFLDLGNFGPTWPEV